LSTYSKSAKSLKSKHKAAVKGIEVTQAAFEGLDKGISDSTRKAWSKEVADAMEKRGEYLKIYQVKVDEGKNGKI
jgi:post-segregation antitoxin (ccd killing protein)